MSDKHKLWVEKYRPKTIDNYIFYDSHQEAKFKEMIDNRSVPHLLLSGVQGSGKTTIAEIVIRAMELDPSDVLTINASRENNVETVREKITSFVETWAMSDYKIVYLAEADFISLPAQAILREIMEKNADQIRVVMTCNYVNRIMPAIVSRCQHYRFKSSDRNDIAEYCISILASEKVRFDLDVLDKYIARSYPDIRATVNSLQQHSIGGVLGEPTSEGQAGDWKFELLDLLEKDKWQQARKLVTASIDGDEWVDLYRFLYENLHRAPKFNLHRDKWEEGIVTIAKHLYQHSIVADAEINAAALMIGLGQL